ncbi:EpsG family protein [Moraxella osloensis]|nr:EpsG family protein [Moraxella osloensis]UAY37202.1 EpsG family protein [Moraxella osloensis]
MKENLIGLNEYYLYFNIIYIITAYFVILNSIYYEIRNNSITLNRLSRYFTIIIILLLILITGYRAQSVGADTENYYILLWQDTPEIKFDNEFLFPLISKFLQFFAFDYTAFLLLIASLFFIFIYKSLENYTRFYKANILMAQFSFMSFFFFSSMSMNVIRQGVSLSIILYSFTLLLKNDNKYKVFIFLILAISFHLTSIIPVFLIFISYYLSSKQDKIIYFLIIIYFIALYLAFIDIGLLNISPILSNALGNNNKNIYINGETYDYVVGFKPQFAAFNTFFLFIASYVRKNLTNQVLKKQYDVIFIYYILASSVFFLAFQLPFSDRWGLFSWVIIPFLIIPLFYSPYLKAKIKIHYILMLILIYVGFKFYAS